MRETSMKLLDFLTLSSVGAPSSSESPRGLLGFRETSYLPAVDMIVIEFARRFMENMGNFDTIMCFDPKYEGFLDLTSVENFVREFPHTFFGDVIESLNLELKMLKFSRQRQKHARMLSSFMTSSEKLQSYSGVC